MERRTFSVPYSVVDKLSPSERFVYYELCRLSAQEDVWDEEFQMRVPKGSLLTSHLRFAKEIDMPYSSTSIALDELAAKGWIEVTPLDIGLKYQTFYMIHVKDVFTSLSITFARLKEQILKPRIMEETRQEGLA